MSDKWRNWNEIETEMIASGQTSEARIQTATDHLRDRQRAYRLAEIRKERGLRQEDVAAAMHVTQTRVSAVEHGDLGRKELATVASYVEALGGRVKVVADFGDEQLTLS